MTSQCSVYICDFGLARTKPDTAALEDEQTQEARGLLQAEELTERSEVESTRLDHDMDGGEEAHECDFESVSCLDQPNKSDS